MLQIKAQFALAEEMLYSNGVLEGWNTAGFCNRKAYTRFQMF